MLAAMLYAANIYMLAKIIILLLVISLCLVAQFNNTQQAYAVDILFNKNIMIMWSHQLSQPKLVRITDISRIMSLAVIIKYQVANQKHILTLVADTMPVASYRHLLTRANWSKNA